MNRYTHLSKLLTVLLMSFSLSLIACEGDEESETETEAGTSTEAGTEEAGTEEAGTEEAGTEEAGTEEAGTEEAGTEEAGTEEAGQTVEAGQMMPEEFMCAQDALQVQRASVRPSPNLVYTGVDDRFNFDNILQIEFTVAPVVGQPVLFEGQTPQNCTVCAFMGVQCTADGCAEVFFASSGELNFTEFGTTGEELSFDISGLNFSELNRETGELDDSNQKCLNDQTFSALQPTEVGDVIPDTFALQNCETGEMVNVKEFGANANGIWYFATAGWCPACRETLNYLFAEVFPTYTENTIRPMIVVSEDDQAEPATLAFCRSYAARYTDTSADFYVDASLSTTFTNLWAYFGDDGSFGLPWQAVIEGGTGVYTYADGAPGIDTVEDVINRLLE